MEVSVTNDEQNCEHCLGKTSPAIGECKQCKQYICKECFQQHRKATVSKDHELVNKEVNKVESGFEFINNAILKENNTEMTHERGEVKRTTMTDKTFSEGTTQIIIRKVYLLDQEYGDTTKKFTEWFAASLTKIDLVRVRSIDECKETYPIAVLCRRQTDRAAEDIEIVMAKVKKEHYARIALINIHVANSEKNLPLVPTAEKISEYHDIGMILDFGYIPSNRFAFISPQFCPRKNSEGVSSLIAFEEFVEPNCS